MRSDPKSRRWYKTRDWRILRKLVIEQQPLCARCGAPGQVVDHIIPHKGRADLFFRFENLQTLCAPCHNSHKARMENGRLDTECSTDGYPIDPGHPWNEKK